MTLARSVIEVGKGGGRASSSALLAIAEKLLQERHWQRKKLENAVLFSKNEQLEVGAKPAGVRPFSNWDISPYTVSVSSDMIVDGAL